MAPAPLLRTALLAALAGAALPFAPRPPGPPARAATALSSSPGSDRRDGDDRDDGDGGGIEDFERERMNIVRSLQRSYYRDSAPPGVGSESNATSWRPARASLDPETGAIDGLPLWRVGWVETPGRRNCLNVHEMQYTHMFERIISQSSSDADGRENDEPLYFGHLYLPGGTSSAKSNEERYRLKTWREELDDDRRFDDHGSSSTLNSPDISTPAVDRSAVVGCLMEILDHQRMEDGRLMILVQALERFVVEDIVDVKPYGVANVRILLDEEDLPWEGRAGGTNVDEGRCESLRGRAVAASFGYHDYEFDRPRLPVKEGGLYLSKEEVPYVEISRLLPFARYSADETCLEAANEKAAGVEEAATVVALKDIDDGDGSSLASGEPPLERQLQNGGITWDPPPVPNVVLRRSRDDLDCDALETLLWLALDDFCRATGFALPEEVRILLPPELDYLDVTTDRRLQSDYPKIRRQRRLSYLAPALIENLEVPMKGMRQVWLNAPSTRARLLGALERYDYLNNKMMGRFQ